MKDGRSTRYVGVLDIPERTIGKWAIKHEHLPAGAELKTGNMRTTVFGQRIKTLKFDAPTRWHKLTESGGVWMSDLPIEQRQTDELVLSAQGHVLVGGLGLGYAALALARRKKVTAVTVVEKSWQVGDLTWAATLRAAGVNAYKLTLVTEDLFTYLERLRPGGHHFNWALYDIWAADGEHTFHTMVVPLRRLSYGKVRHVVCWNEDVMRAQLMFGIHNRIRFMGLTLLPGLDFALPTLEELCDGPTGNMYMDWSIPFWRSMRDRFGTGQALLGHEPEVMAAAHRYVSGYAMKKEKVDGHQDNSVGTAEREAR